MLTTMFERHVNEHGPATCLQPQRVSELWRVAEG